MLSLYNNRRKKTTFKRKYGGRNVARPWATYNPRKALWNPRDPFADSFVHKFRRLGQIARIAAGAGNLPELKEDAGPGAYAFTLGPTSTDIIGGLSLQQFGMTYSCHLDSVLNYQEFTDLFNEYKIDKVDLRIDLINGPSGAPNVAGVLPELYIRYDPNDVIMPGSFNDLAQSANTLQCSFSQKTSHHYSFVPKASVQIYAPIPGTGYGAPAYNSMWFDTSGSSSAIDMYGLKLFWRNFSAPNGSGLVFQFQPTFFLSLRRPR